MSDAAGDILIVDDDAAIRALLATMFEAEKRRATAAASKAEALARFRADRPRVVFCDVHLPDGDGIELVELFTRLDPLVQVVVMTGDGEVDVVVRAMRAGALDFLEKPFTRALIREKLALAVKNLPPDAPGGDTGIRGDSAAIRATLERVRRVAASPTMTVLVLGESGTGKELVSRAVHALSMRASGPFVAVNCAAITGTLLESELFGYERGAFTGAASEGKKGLFEAASGGTIFLDEIGETEPGFQSALLRVVETRASRRVGGLVERPVDVRIVASTNRDLAAEVEGGRFRSDLFFRLFVVPIVLPPLRERAGDVRVLAEFLLDELARGGGRRARLSSAALAAMESYAWPGNVRELKNAVERASVLATKDEISPEDLALGLGAPRASGDGARSGGIRLDDMNLEKAERALVARALELAQGNKSRAAEILGINRTTLYARLREMGIN